MENNTLSNRIMQIAKDHARKVKDAGTTLAQLVELWVNDKRGEAKAKYDELATIEADADKIKNMLIAETAEVDKLGLAGDSDFSTLVLKADSIIDYAEGVGQRLLFCKWQALPEKVSQKAIQLSEAIMEAAVLVREMIFAYFEKADKVPRICNQIDGAERKSDVLFREIQGILFSDELNDVDLRKILPFLDAMEHLEDMGDLAEQLADSFKISYVAKFGAK